MRLVSADRRYLEEVEEPPLDGIRLQNYMSPQTLMGGAIHLRVWTGRHPQRDSKRVGSSCPVRTCVWVLFPLSKSKTGRGHRSSSAQRLSFQ